jgi:hypothetical protein
MLYEATVAFNPTVEAMGEEALLLVAVSCYLADRGREGDAGLVAVTERGRRVVPLPRGGGPRPRVRGP